MQMSLQSISVCDVDVWFVYPRCPGEVVPAHLQALSLIELVPPFNFTSSLIFIISARFDRGGSSPCLTVSAADWNHY